MCETQVKVMNYLTNKVKNGEKLPSLSDLSKELNINYATLSDNLIKLRKMNKISYKSGKILNVYLENYKGNVVPQAVQQHKNKYSIKELEEKYDKIVKEIVCEYIRDIDASSFTNDNINKVLTSITLITNKIKNKLFK